MCTMAALNRGGRTVLLKNFDYRATATGWVHYHGFGGDLDHFALVDHAQQGLNSGLNTGGLALQISRSRADDPTPERAELRTVLNAQVLAGCTSVRDGVAHIERYAADHPEMFGGNVMLGDEDGISVTEYFGGKFRSEGVSEKCLVRANHSVFGLIDNQRDGSLGRHEVMSEFVDDLFLRMDDLDDEEVIAECKTRLRQPPLLHEATRSSFVTFVQLRRVDWCVGDGAWNTFRFAGGA